MNYFTAIEEMRDWVEVSLSEKLTESESMAMLHKHISTDKADRANYTDVLNAHTHVWGFITDQPRCAKCGMSKGECLACQDEASFDFGFLNVELLTNHHWGRA